MVPGMPERLLIINSLVIILITINFIIQTTLLLTKIYRGKVAVIPHGRVRLRCSACGVEYNIDFITTHRYRINRIITDDPNVISFTETCPACHQYCPQEVVADPAKVVPVAAGQIDPSFKRFFLYGAIPLLFLMYSSGGCCITFTIIYIIGMTIITVKHWWANEHKSNNG